MEHLKSRSFRFLSRLWRARFLHKGRGSEENPHLDHVFVIVVESHGYAQILNNPTAPLVAKYANTANLVTNNFARAPQPTELPGGCEDESDSERHKKPASVLITLHPMFPVKRKANPRPE